MPHGHSAIDSLIALTALRKYQKGGKVDTAAESFERFWKNFSQGDARSYGVPKNESGKQRLREAWEGSGSPYIKEMDLEGFKKYGVTFKKEVPRPQDIEPGVTAMGRTGENWESRYDPETEKWYETTPRAFFLTATPERRINLKNILPNIGRSLIPGPIGDAYRLAIPQAPITEWQRVPTDTTYIQPGNLDELLSELGHAGQHAPLTQEQLWEMDKRYMQEKEKYGDIQSAEERGMYGQEGTIEHEAHSVREPLLWNYLYGVSDELKFPQSRDGSAQ